MELRYVGNRPLNFTLYSGLSLHVYPNRRKTPVYISNQDWDFSKNLKPYKRLFRIIEEEEKDSHKSKKKSIKRKDLVLEDSKKDPTLQTESAVLDKRGQVIGVAPITDKERADKTLKKHTKITRRKTKGNPKTDKNL